MISDEDGAVAVRRARRAVAALFGARGPAPEDASSIFREPRGAFVTWRVHEDGSLRGCIGYALPVLPLAEAVDRAAIAAAIDDPRFLPVSADELGSLVAEVSVLGLPKLVTSAAPQGSVEPGRDGLLVETDRTSGLLLPQVAVEQGWSAEEFLSATCEKAGLRPGAWRGPGVRVSTFGAEVFAEESPYGPIARLAGVGAEPATPTPEPRAPRTVGPRPPRT